VRFSNDTGLGASIDDSMMVGKGGLPRFFFRLYEGLGDTERAMVLGSPETMMI